MGQMRNFDEMSGQFDIKPDLLLYQFNISEVKDVKVRKAHSPSQIDIMYGIVFCRLNSQT